MYVYTPSKPFNYIHSLFYTHSIDLCNILFVNQVVKSIYLLIRNPARLSKLTAGQPYYKQLVPSTTLSLSLS